MFLSIKIYLFEKVKGRVRKLSTELEEKDSIQIHSNIPTFNNKHKHGLKQSHTRHCTSPPHSSIVYRVTINVGFHRNNKMLTKSANTAAIIEMWQIVKNLRIHPRRQHKSYKIVLVLSVVCKKTTTPNNINIKNIKLTI